MKIMREQEICYSSNNLAEPWTLRTFATLRTVLRKMLRPHIPVLNVEVMVPHSPMGHPSVAEIMGVEETQARDSGRRLT